MNWVKVASALVTTALAGATASAQDGPRSGPPGFAVEFENEVVQVVRIRLAPHEKIPMHELTPRVAVWLSDAHLKLTYADGRTSEQRWHAGQTAWLEAQKHAGENLESKPIEFIAVIPKARDGTAQVPPSPAASHAR